MGHHRQPDGSPDARAEIHELRNRLNAAVCREQIATIKLKLMRETLWRIGEGPGGERELKVMARMALDRCDGLDGAASS